MVWHLLLCDDELGQRVDDALGISADDVRSLKPVPTLGGARPSSSALTTSATTARATSRAS
jgi:hypothetical protein